MSNVFARMLPSPPTTSANSRASPRASAQRVVSMGEEESDLPKPLFQVQAPPALLQDEALESSELRRSVSICISPGAETERSSRRESTSSRGPVRGPQLHLLNSVRITRRQFYEGIGPRSSSFSFLETRSAPIRSTVLASLSAALSYVAAMRTAADTASTVDTAPPISPSSLAASLQSEDSSGIKAFLRHKEQLKSLAATTSAHDISPSTTSVDATTGRRTEASSAPGSFRLVRTTSRGGYGPVQLDFGRPLAVTVDHLVVANKLPLVTMMSPDVSLHSAHDMTTRYLDGHDAPAALDGYMAVLETMDMRLAESPANPQDLPSAPRELAIDPKSLRDRLHETQSSHAFATIVFYDRLLLQDSVTVEEEEDEDVAAAAPLNKSFLQALGTVAVGGDDDLTGGDLLDASAFRDARTVTDAAVVVGMTRNDRVQLAVPHFTDGRSGMVVKEVSLAALHRAMCALHPYTGRANGLIVLRRSSRGNAGSRMGATGTTVIPTQSNSEQDDVDAPPSPLLATIPDSNELRRHHIAEVTASTFPVALQSPQHCLLSTVPTTVGTHLTALSIALARLRGEPLERSGVNLNEIVSGAKLPMHLVTPSTSADVETVSAIAKRVTNEAAVSVIAVPFAQSLWKAGAPCAMSESQLMDALLHLRDVHNSATMLLQLDPEFVHWTNCSAHSNKVPHWVVVGRVEESEDTCGVEIIETQPSRYGARWSIDLGQLHRSMANLGYVVLAEKSRGSAVQPAKFLPQPTPHIVLSAQALPPYRSPFDVLGPFSARLRQTAQPALAGGSCLNAPLALAAQAIGSAIPSFDFAASILSASSLPIGDLLDDGIGLHDFAAVVRRALHEAQIEGAMVDVVPGGGGPTRYHSIVDRCCGLTPEQDDGGVPAAPELSSGGWSPVSAAGRGGVGSLGGTLVSTLRNEDMLHFAIFQYAPADLMGHHVRCLRGPALPTQYALLVAEAPPPTTATGATGVRAWPTPAVPSLGLPTLEETAGPAAQQSSTIAPEEGPLIVVDSVSHEPWAVPRAAMYHGMQTTCPTTGRPCGLVYLRIPRAAAAAAAGQGPITPALSPLKLPGDDELSGERGDRTQQHVGATPLRRAPAPRPFLPTTTPILDGLTIAVAEVTERTLDSTSTDGGGPSSRGSTSVPLSADAFLYAALSAAATDVDKAQLQPSSLAMVENPLRTARLLLKLYSHAIQRPANTWSVDELPVSSEHALVDALAKAGHGKELPKGASPSVALLLYAPSDVHSASTDMWLSAALVRGVQRPESAEGETVITLAEARPTCFGEDWARPAAELVVAARRSRAAFLLLTQNPTPK